MQILFNMSTEQEQEQEQDQDQDQDQNQINQPLPVQEKKVHIKLSTCTAPGCARKALYNDFTLCIVHRNQAVEKSEYTTDDVDNYYKTVYCPNCEPSKKDDEPKVNLSDLCNLNYCQNRNTDKLNCLSQCCPNVKKGEEQHLRRCPKCEECICGNLPGFRTNIYDKDGKLEKEIKLCMCHSYCKHCSKKKLIPPEDRQIARGMDKFTLGDKLLFIAFGFIMLPSVIYARVRAFFNNYFPNPAKAKYIEKLNNLEERSENVPR